MRPEEALNQGRINLASYTLTLCSIAFFPDAPAEGVDSAWIRSGIRSGGPGRCPPPSYS